MSSLPRSARFGFALVLGLVLCTGGRPCARAEAEDEPAEVRSLRARSGLAATRGLCRLIRQGDDPIRLAALKALGEIGVRSPGVGDTLREAMDEGRAIEEETAAVVGLGLLGGPEHMPLLIDLLKGPDESLRGVAHLALKKLTGERMRQDYGEWFRWWRKAARAKPAAVRHAILQLPGAEGRKRENLRDVLARDGWIDVEFLEDTVDEWLSDGDRVLRASAFHVVSALRLGGVTSAVESALPHLSTVDGEAGLRAVRALGLSGERLAPYWRRRLEGGR